MTDPTDRDDAPELGVGIVEPTTAQPPVEDVGPRHDRFGVDLRRYRHAPGATNPAREQLIATLDAIARDEAAEIRAVTAAHEERRRVAWDRYTTAVLGGPLTTATGSPGAAVTPAADESRNPAAPEKHGGGGSSTPTRPR